MKIKFINSDIKYNQCVLNENEYITISNNKFYKINNRDKKLYINEKSETIELYENKEKAWWLSDMINVYSKKGKLRQLLRERYIRSQKLLEDYIKVIDINNLYIPWIPGASFMTNGIEIKIKIVSLRNDRMNGIKEIFKRGYSGFKKEKEKKEISKINKGIHKIDNLYLDTENINNYTFMGIDPGVVKPMSACFIKENVLPIAWKTDERCDILQKSIETNIFIDRDDYKNIIKENENENHEKKRREINNEYNNSIKEMTNTKKKTCMIEENIEYNKIKFKYWNEIRKEKINIKRTLYRFIKNINIHKAIDKSVKKILKQAKETSEKEGKELIIFFGDGTFKVGGKGYSCIPKKKFVKKIGEKYKIIITNEANTSKLCPFTFKILNTINNTRLRECKTNNEEQINYYESVDRDTLGSLSICQKGFYELIRNPIEHYNNSTPLTINVQNNS